MIGTIARHELRLLLMAPSSWLLLAGGQFIQAWMLLLRMDQYQNLQGRLPDAAGGVTDLIALPGLLLCANLGLLLIPLLGMRGFSDEWRRGSMPLLLSAPLPAWQLVVGKWFGLSLFIGLFLLLSSLLPLSLSLGGNLDTGRILAGLLGLAGLFAVYLAVSLMFSALAAQAAIAAGLSYALLLGLWSLQDLATNWVWLHNLALAPWLDRFLAGRVDFAAIAYFLLLWLLAMGLCVRLVVDYSQPKLRFYALAGAPMTMLAGIVAVSLAIQLITRLPPGWDLTDGGSQSLAPASIAVLETLDQPLQVESYAPQNSLLRAGISEVITRYQRYKPDIQLEFIDPIADPQRAREEGIQLAGELVLRYAQQREQLQDLSEQALTNALQRLAMGENRWLGVVSGHGERSLYDNTQQGLSDLNQLLEQRGFFLQELDLGKIGSIPQSATLLMIASPLAGFLPTEKKLLRDYLREGGSLLLLVDPLRDLALEFVTQTLGVEILPGVIVDANAASIGLDSATIAVVARYPKQRLTQNLGITLFPQTSALHFAGGNSWQAIPLLRTLQNSWNETGPIRGEIKRNREAGEMAGPLTIGWWLRRARSDGGEQQVMVIGDSDFLTNGYLNQQDNQDLALRLMRQLSNNPRFLTIEAGVSEDRRLAFSQNSLFLLSVGQLLGLPLSLFALGLWAYWRRRRG